MWSRFPTETDCIVYLEQIRWQGTPVCPHCNATRSTPLLKERRHRCNSCHTSFSVTVATLFHRTHLPLQTWFAAIALVDPTSAISTRRLARELGVSKNTAWSLLQRIRVAWSEPGQRPLLRRIIEIDSDEGVAP